MKNKNRGAAEKAFTGFIIKEGRIIFAVALAFVLLDRIVRLLDFNWLYTLSQPVYDAAVKFYTVQLMSAVPYIFFGLRAALSAVNIYRTLKKMSSYMNEILSAADMLYDKNIDYIKLSPELSRAEKKLNHIKADMERNERAARESEERKNELIVYLAHDIKTPLTSMIGYLSLLDEIEDMPRAQRKRYTAVALDKSYRLEELINELFETARFNGEKILLEKEELSLNLMLSQIIDDFYPILKERGKSIQLNAREDIKIFADPDKLSRVFSNLVKNAVNYSRGEGDIVIDVNKAGEEVKVRVTNTGKQIPREKLDKIFEKFYRRDSSRHSATGGSGLGLAIAKEIAELHGGSISAESENYRTTFTVTLPIK